jgi:hypothetical protein
MNFPFPGKFFRSTGTDFRGTKELFFVECKLLETNQLKMTSGSIIGTRIALNPPGK